MAKKTKTMPAVALWVALAAAVMLAAAPLTVAQEKNWEDGVKDKANEAADGAKSWTDWAVGSIKGKFGEEEKPSETLSATAADKMGVAKEKVTNTATDTVGAATDTVGAAKDTVVKMATDTQDKANEAAKKVGDHLQAGVDTAKDTASQMKSSAGMGEL